MEIEIVDSGPPIEDYSHSKHVGAPSSGKDKGPSFLFAKPLRAPRSKRRKPWMYTFFLFFFLFD